MKYLFFLALVVLVFPHLTHAMPTEATLILLADKESGTRDDIKILDVNGKYSYGRYQFQLETFLHYGKQYDILPDNFTETEARILIHNPKVQIAIARAMIEDGLACKSVGWLNSCKRLGII